MVSQANRRQKLSGRSVRWWASRPNRNVRFDCFKRTSLGSSPARYLVEHDRGVPELNRSGIACNENGNPVGRGALLPSEVIMHSAGKLHPEWGYVAPAPGFMHTARIALVATVIGAIGGAVVIVSLVERPGSNDDHASIAAHALVTSAPVIPKPAAPPKAVALTQAPIHAPPATASARSLAPAAASTSIPSAVVSMRKPNGAMLSPANAPMPASAASLVKIPTTAEATAAVAATRAETAPETASAKSSIRKLNTRKHWREVRHRRLFDQYGERGFCCAGRQGKFGSMHDDW